ncbi:MAG TPA: DUF4129 domain-containing protein, partial [Gemmataceae bacterium]|nr:DUF4129 domain-containing protein [Gemmataceae bacterium]
TTCFLGLRRYLRQRNMKMPAKMVGSWLALGSGLIAILLVVAAVLPRPSSETSLLELTTLGSKKRDASNQSFVKDGSGKDKGQPGDTKQQKDGPAPGKDAKGGKDGQGQQSGKGQKDSQSGNQKDGKDGGQKGGDQKDGKGDGQKNGGDKSQKKDQGQSKGADQNKSEGGSSSNDTQKSEKDQSGQKSGNSSTSPSKPLLPHLPQLGQISTLLKWIVLAVLAALVVFNLLRSGLKWLANFTKWARDLLDSLRAFWARLFGRREAEHETAVESEPAPAGAKRPRPFASFRNPFLDGSADRLSPDQLVRYSFAALQSWAYERDLARQPEETPLEFAQRVGDQAPVLEGEALQLSNLYARAVYARGALPTGSLEPARRFWDKLEAVAEQPLSA